MSILSSCAERVLSERLIVSFVKGPVVGNVLFLTGEGSVDLTSGEGMVDANACCGLGVVKRDMGGLGLSLFIRLLLPYLLLEFHWTFDLEGTELKGGPFLAIAVDLDLAAGEEVVNSEVRLFSSTLLFVFTSG